MADTIRKIVELYLSGEKTYPEALDVLGDLIGYPQAYETLRLAVEEEGGNDLLQLATVA
jgi:hypothetical protein